MHAEMMLVAFLDDKIADPGILKREANTCI
jgi:hypothetical protein